MSLIRPPASGFDTPLFPNPEVQTYSSATTESPLASYLPDVSNVTAEGVVFAAAGSVARMKVAADVAQDARELRIVKNVADVARDARQIRMVAEGFTLASEANEARRGIKLLRQIGILFQVARGNVGSLLRPEVVTAAGAGLAAIIAGLAAKTSGPKSPDEERAQDLFQRAKQLAGEEMRRVIEEIADRRSVSVQEVTDKLQPIGMQNLFNATLALQMRTLGQGESGQVTQQLALAIITDMDQTAISNRPEGREVYKIWLLEWAYHKVMEPGVVPFWQGVRHSAGGQPVSLIVLSATPGTSFLPYLKAPVVHRMVSQRFAQEGISFDQYLTKDLAELWALAGGKTTSGFPFTNHHTNYKLIKLFEQYIALGANTPLLLIGDNNRGHNDALAYVLFGDSITGRINSAQMENVLDQITDFDPWKQQAVALGHLLQDSTSNTPRVMIYASHEEWAELQRVYGTRVIPVEDYFQASIVMAAAERSTVDAIVAAAERIPIDEVEGARLRPDLYQSRRRFNATVSFDELVQHGILDPDTAWLIYEKLAESGVVQPRNRVESYSVWSQRYEPLPRREGLAPDEVDYQAAVEGRNAADAARAVRKAAEKEARRAASPLRHPVNALWRALGWGQNDQDPPQ